MTFFCYQEEFLVYVASVVNTIVIKVVLIHSLNISYIKAFFFFFLFLIYLHFNKHLLNTFYDTVSKVREFSSSFLKQARGRNRYLLIVIAFKHISLFGGPIIL